MENNNNIVDTLNNIASNSVINNLSGDEIYELREWLGYYKKIKSWFLLPVGIVAILVVCIGVYYKVENIEKNFETFKTDAKKVDEDIKQDIGKVNDKIDKIDNKLENKTNSADVLYLRNKIDELEKKVFTKK